MNALHSKQTAEWYTPPDIVQRARWSLGEIDLDPATTALANATVMADLFFTKEYSGLDQPWRGRVFVNPPGGLVREFWRKALTEYTAGRMKACVWIGYSLQQLQTLQTDGPGPVQIAAAICYPRKRIAFIDAEGKPSRSPTHANYIAYLGQYPAGFRLAFESYGDVR